MQAVPALLQLRPFCGEKLPALNPDALKAAEFGAEAEARNAKLERGAVAVKEALKKGFELV